MTQEVYRDAAENETAVCVGVPYNVDDESKVDDAASVNFTVNGETAIYDCFLLAPGATFSVAPENATEINVSPSIGHAFKKCSDFSRLRSSHQSQSSSTPLDRSPLSKQFCPGTVAEFLDRQRAGRGI